MASIQKFSKINLLKSEVEINSTLIENISHIKSPKLAKKTLKEKPPIRTKFKLFFSLKWSINGYIQNPSKPIQNSPKIAEKKAKKQLGSVGLGIEHNWKRKDVWLELQCRSA